MSETAGRLLALLALLQSRPEWPGTELAARLGVSTRTIRKDIDRLRELVYPVNANRGSAGGYRLGAGGKLPPLMLDDEEAVAVAVGLRAATGLGGIELASARALTQVIDVARQGVGILGPATPAAARLENIARFLDFVSESTIRAAEQARAVLHTKADAAAQAREGAVPATPAPTREETPRAQAPR